MNTGILFYQLCCPTTHGSIVARRENVRGIYTYILIIHIISDSFPMVAWRIFSRARYVSLELFRWPADLARCVPWYIMMFLLNSVYIHFVFPFVSPHPLTPPPGLLPRTPLRLNELQIHTHTHTGARARTNRPTLCFVFAPELLPKYPLTLPSFPPPYPRFRHPFQVWDDRGPGFLHFDGDTPGKPLGYVSEHGLLHSALFRRVKDFEAEGVVELTAPAQVRRGNGWDGGQRALVSGCICSTVYSTLFLLLVPYCSVFTDTPALFFFFFFLASLAARFRSPSFYVRASIHDSVAALAVELCQVCTGTVGQQ